MCVYIYIYVYNIFYIFFLVNVTNCLFSNCLYVLPCSFSTVTYHAKILNFGVVYSAQLFLQEWLLLSLKTQPSNSIHIRPIKDGSVPLLESEPYDSLNNRLNRGDIVAVWGAQGLRNR